MTSEELPWLGLAFDQARRVDRNGKQDFFWAVVENNAPAVVLLLAPETDQLLPLPKIRSLDVRYGTVGTSSALLIVLREQEHIDLFATLCRDVVQAGEEASDNADALNRSLRRTLRWHHLLRGGAPGRLSVEEQRGLIGELQFLEKLCEKLTPRAAVETWKGPEGAAKDFELHKVCVEVKARRGAARPYVQISSEDQLSDVEGSRVFLRVQEVDAAVRPEGKTLTDHVKDVDTLFQNSDLESYQLWESALSATGFEWEHDYSDRRWSIGSVSTFSVHDGFPRIAHPIPAGVVNLKYAVSLDACQPFVVEQSEFETNLVQE
ncbi:PD-(D/E)XK motif protein [Ruegeria jejuensis]|uniref:PD-(D/E)XK motif protein n=1 Tax=Ruegeria jejuensis TaxID=3233338 RepID=UPI00355C2E2E